MSRIQDLKLDSFLITKNPEILGLHVPDLELLRFFNGTGPSPQNMSGSTVVCSASMLDTWTTYDDDDAEQFKPARMHRRCYYAKEIRAIAHYLLRRGPPSGGSANNPEPRYDDGIAEKAGYQGQPQEKPDDDSSNSPASQSVAPSFVRVRLGEENAPEPAHQTAKSRRVVELMARCQPAAHWLFKHPDGRVAVGEEPLEFFSDWKESDGETSYGSECWDDETDPGWCSRSRERRSS